MRFALSLLFFTSFIFLSEEYVFSQTDSLEVHLQKAKEDTTKVNILNDEAWELSTDAPEEALTYGQRALELAERIKFKNGIAGACHNIGWIYYNLGDFQKALDYNFRSLEIKKGSGSKKNIASSYNNIALVYKELGMYDKAQQYNFDALRLREESGAADAVVVSLNNIGIIYYQQKNYDKALAYYQKSLEKAKALGNKKGIKRAITNIGIIYHDTGNYEKALEYFSESLRLNEELRIKAGIAQSLNNLGSTYNDMKEYDKALDYFRQSLKINEEIGNKMEITLNLNNLAGVYNFKGDYKLALEYSKKALTLAKELNLKEEIEASYETYSDIYFNLKDYKRAYEYYLLYSDVKDSLLNEETQKRMTEMEVKYETEKKEAKIDLLIKKNEIKRIWIYSLSAFLILICVVGGLIYNRYKIKQRITALLQQQKETALRQKMTELELRALRAQMDPHFIFNCINSIQNSLEDKNVDKADEYLSKFAKLLRFVLETSAKSYVSLSDELKYLEWYLSLESFRFNNRFDFKIHIEPNVDIENTEVPTMLIQPFIENAIKHGLMYKPSDGKIVIGVKSDDGTLAVTVEDNGIGRKKSQEMKQKLSSTRRSLGMSVTQERLQILNAQKNQAVGINITDLYSESQQPTGTRVEIQIPV